MPPVAAAALGAVAVERGRCSINRASSRDLGTAGWVAMEIDLNQITRGSAHSLCMCGVASRVQQPAALYTRLAGAGGSEEGGSWRAGV